MRIVSSLARISLASAIFCSSAGPVLGGPNEGGMLVLHHDASLVYTDDGSDYCRLASLESCADAVVRIDSENAVVFHAFAAFPEHSEPRLSGLTYGISYGSEIQLVAWKACGDFELANPDWPASGTGTAVTWGQAQTNLLVEVYWFAAYSATSVPQEFSLGPHPTQGGNFGDDGIPAELDEIAGYGTMGFWTDGVVACPAPLEPGSCCFDDGSCLVLLELDCRRQGGSPGEGTTCEPNPCSQPGACCYADGHCELTVPSSCYGDYQGDGTSCDPNPCPQPGACCYPDGHCERVQSESCGGDYQGDETLCDPSPCPLPGACCLADGTCLIVLADECPGEFLGESIPCDPNPCPIPRGACCFSDGRCESLTEEECGGGGGDFRGDGTLCDPNPCPAAGACCLADGNCLFLVPDECQGDYLGDNVSCEPNPCPGPEGACCFLTGACEFLPEYLCAEEGGTFHLDTPCDPNPCTACSPLLSDRLAHTHKGPPDRDLFRDADRRDGPNRGGTLILHHNPLLVYTSDESYCGRSSLSACEDANVRVDGQDPAVLHVLAAFAEGTQPRLKGLTLGIEYDVCVRILAAEACGDFELANPDWPESGSGTAVVWTLTQTHLLVEVYWFAAYSATSEPQEFALVPHPTQGGWFGDDSVPSELDLIVGYGTMGFGTEGMVECPITPTPGACCLEDGSCSVVVQVSDCLDQGGTYLGDGTVCDPNPCPQPGACCDDDGNCEFVLPETCANAGGDFQGAGVSCDPNPCPQPLGACCFPDGHCEQLTLEDCSTANGDYQGHHTLCDPNPCPAPVGACCFPDSRCESVTQEDCASLDGEYLGDLVPCDPNPCPQYPGACCFGDGSCAALAEYLCFEQGGTFLGPDTVCDPNPCPQPGACCYDDGRCEFVLPAVCLGSGGVYQGDGVTCDPNPCPQQPGACCFGDGHCEMLPEYLCRDAGGSFLGPDTNCDPNPCSVPTGACCFGPSCEIRTEQNCEQNGGYYVGNGVSCSPNPCCKVPARERHGNATPQPESAGSAHASTGLGHGTVTTEEGRGGCGTLLFNADGTYENGYAWQYGGLVPPDYGAFAECYSGGSHLCSAVFDLTQVGFQSGQSMDILVYDDYCQAPGAVSFTTRVTPGPIAYWPSISRHTFSISAPTPGGSWWVGYWSNWPGQFAGWYVAADLDGFGGCPYTKIAPGIGFPTGWNNVSIIWGPTRAIGIGAEIDGSTPTIDSTWGKIKHLFR